MKTAYFKENWSDEKGDPAGGVASGVGFCISWQNGPLGSGRQRKEPNGAFVETVLDAVIQRIEFYQESRFRSDDNDITLGHLRAVQKHLEARTRDREQRGVEGTHEV